MKLLWVAADKFGSRMIRWGLDSDCSHFAICFDETEVTKYGIPRGVAFHSYGVGTQVVMLREFLEFYTVVHALEPVKAVDEEKVYQAVLDQEQDLSYDYAALLWFSWRGLLAKVGFAPINPGDLNRWQSDKARLCTGIAPAVLKALDVELPKGIDPELTPPHELYNLLSETGRFRWRGDWAEQANEI